MINFAFENSKDFLNFLECNDINSSGIRRFGTSPLAMKMLRMAGASAHQVTANNPYIVSASVNHSPNDWAKKDGCLTHLNHSQLADIKNKKAMVMLDQSLEGYQTTWLWDYLHKDCQNTTINPSALIYVTGNLLAESQYDAWCIQNRISDRINVISYPIFENDVHEISKKMGLRGDFQAVYNYKKNNIDKIVDYSCLQKRLRNHRIWFYNRLYNENILKYGLVSMNICPIEDVYLDGKMLDKSEIQLANVNLPSLIYGKSNNAFDDSYYIRRITDKVFNDVWVSVISEAIYSDYENSIFISEKTFKPITCMHPFIILGAKGSLKKLRELGYKTFEGFIDESYDNLSSFERFEAIIKELKRIISIEDKLSWYNSMRDILEHNFNTLTFNSTDSHTLFHKVENAYVQFFQKEN